MIYEARNSQLPGNACPVGAHKLIRGNH